MTRVPARRPVPKNGSSTHGVLTYARLGHLSQAMLDACTKVAVDRSDASYDAFLSARAAYQRYLDAIVAQELRHERELEEGR